MAAAKKGYGPSDITATGSLRPGWDAPVAPPEPAAKHLPVIGLTVHYRDGQHTRAAIVTEVYDAASGECELAVLLPRSHGAPLSVRAKYAHDLTPGSWCWP